MSRMFGAIGIVLAAGLVVFVAGCPLLDPCTFVTCDDGEVCEEGECVAEVDPCEGVTCEAGEECDNGDCVAVDLCEGVTCEDGEECVDGDCVAIAP